MMSSLKQKSKWVNIAVDRKNYADLRLLGEVPDSFNTVIGRLLDQNRELIESIKKAKKLRGE